jgi:hypothetical protein
VRARIAWSPFSLVVFDKGGTLIDFRAMWCGWAMDLAQRLETRLGPPIAERFFEALEFDPRSGRIAPTGRLAAFPMSSLRVLTADVLTEAGLSGEAAKAMVAAVCGQELKRACHDPTRHRPRFVFHFHARKLEPARSLWPLRKHLLRQDAHCDRSGRFHSGGVE